MKKILGITAIAVIIALVGAASYFFLVYKPSNPEAGIGAAVRDFLPFGRGSEGQGGNGQAPNGDGNETGFGPDNEFNAKTLEAFRIISKDPVAGYVEITSDPSGQIVRFTDRATGHTFDYHTATGEVATITNTTIPRIVEALWNRNGSSVILRYFNENSSSVNTYAAKLAKASSTDAGEIPQSLEGSFLEGNIDGLSILGNSGKVVGVTPSSSGATVATWKLDGTGRTAVISSPLREWQIQGINSDSALLTTKPAPGVAGFAYFLNLKTGVFTKVAGGEGLTALASPDGSYVLVSGSADHYLLKLVNISEGSVKPLGVSTLPEKCVWNRAGTEAFCAVPRAPLQSDFVKLWYQGKTSTDDSIWVIEAATGYSSVLFSNRNKADNFDAIKLGVDENASQIYFINKKTSMLWMLDLKLLFPEPEPAATSTTI